MSSTFRHAVRPWLPPAVLDRYKWWRHGAALRARAELLASRDVLAEKPLVELFPGVAAHELAFPAGQIPRRRDMVLPLTELLSLAAICRHLEPAKVLEIGTYTGATTLLMAMNTPAGAVIHTVDLDPATYSGGTPFEGVEPFQVGAAFRDHPTGSKIRQFLGDSRAFSEPSLRGGADLVFIDANHSYEFVKADTELAFSMLRPGGVVIWDDYWWLEQHAECAGVTQAVNELSKTRPCFRIAGTRLAIYLDRPSGTAG